MAGLFFTPARVLIRAPIYLSCRFLGIANLCRLYRLGSAKARDNSLPTADGLHTPHSSLAGPRFTLLPSLVPEASGRFRAQAVVLPDGGVTARRSSFWLLTMP